MQDNLQYSMNKAACEGLLFFFSEGCYQKFLNKQSFLLTTHTMNRPPKARINFFFFEHAGIHAGEPLCEILPRPQNLPVTFYNVQENMTPDH